MMPISFLVVGTPQGKGRARACRRGKFIRHYTPEKTAAYEAEIKKAAICALSGRGPFKGPVNLHMRAVFPIPESWSKRKKQAAIAGEILPTVKPDADNIIKAWADGMNGLIYKDDKQIADITFKKRYGLQPFVLATISEVRP